MIELMIAMLIGLMLMGGISSMFLSNKRIYKEQNEMSRLQENARFAMEILIKDIRMAGYTGCSNDIDSVENHVNGATAGNILDFSNAVEGVDNVVDATSEWLPSTSTDQTGFMVAGTDAISVRYVVPSGITVETPYMNTNSAALHVSTGNGLADEDIVAISDCASADIFQITSNNPDTSGTVGHNSGAGVSQVPGNSTKDLSKKYLGDAQIVKFVARRYFIGTGAGGGPALFRLENLDADALELIEGVENMQILYGVDTNGDQIAETYLTAAAVGSADWPSVVSVRFSLLLQTVDENFSGLLDINKYDLLDETNYDPTDDYRRRRIFSSTVQIRNRSN